MKEEQNNNNAQEQRLFLFIIKRFLLCTYQIKIEK